MAHPIPARPDLSNPPPTALVDAIEARLPGTLVDAAVCVLAALDVSGVRPAPAGSGSLLTLAPVGERTAAGPRTRRLHQALAEACGIDEWLALVSLAQVAGIGVSDGADAARED